MNETKVFYNNSYKSEGLGAQRRWPNEELCRFMGRNFFHLDYNARKNMKILEIGCGSGANLRLFASEGFDTYGLDLSEEALGLVPQLVNEPVALKQGDMCELDYAAETFDAIVDVFSSNCLDEIQYEKMTKSIHKVLKTGGKFFSYTPAKTSDAFLKYEPAIKIDESTLNGIYRQDSPFYGNFYPWRFMGVEDIDKYWDKKYFKVTYCEKLSRTYNGMNEVFDFFVFEVEKIL